MQAHRPIIFFKFVLLAVLFWMVAGLILCDEGQPQPIIETETKIPKAETDFAEQPLTRSDCTAILGRDLFRSIQADTIDNKLQKGRLPASSKSIVEQPFQLKLLGTVTGCEELTRAVIEDLNTNVQGLYATGDFVQGACIRKIERDRIILLKDNRRKVLNLYYASSKPVSKENTVKTAMAQKSSDSEKTNVVSPTERKIDKKVFSSNVGRMDAVLRTVKLSPYVVNSKAKGVSITGLEALSVAKYVDLKNGDVIQGVNGQTVTDRRKAFQVLRRAQVLPTYDIEFLRDTKRRTCSFRMK